MDRRKISIFGSTGSIGSTTANLLLQQGGSDVYDINVLTGGDNVKLLADQAIELSARLAITAFEENLEELDNMGFTTVVIWECEVNKTLTYNKLVEKICG